MRGQAGFFDIDERLKRLSDLGDQLDTRCRSNEREKLSAETPSRKAALGVWIQRNAIPGCFASGWL